jgi:hypothetical protein
MRENKMRLWAISLFGLVYGRGLASEAHGGSEVGTRRAPAARASGY